MEKKGTQVPEMTEKIKYQIQEKIKSDQAEIKAIRKRIAQARQQSAFRTKIICELGGVLKLLPPALVLDVRVYYDSIRIECTNEAASASLAHLIVRQTSFQKLHKELNLYGEAEKWKYVGEVEFPKDNPDSWGVDKIEINIYPSYPNPECIPKKTVQTSTYTSWVCERNPT